jgi:hypothetical protein
MMTKLSLFSPTSSRRTTTHGHTAGAVSLCLAVAVTAPGCLDEKAAAHDAPGITASAAMTHTVDPGGMWSNSTYFAGDSGSVVGYGQLRLQYTSAAGAHDVTIPILSNGGFAWYSATDSPGNGDHIRATWTGSGIDDVGCDFVIRFTGSSFFAYTFAEMGCVVGPRSPFMYINEILANEPGSDTAREFVELVNLGNVAADLGGWTLSDNVMTRHVFPAGTMVAPGKALVVFGAASGIPGGLTNAVAASTGTLALNNTGDDVSLRIPDGSIWHVIHYGSDLASQDGVSMNLSPEATPGSLSVLHTAISSLHASPGTRSDGTPW